MGSSIHTHSFSHNNRKAFEITIEVEESHFYEAYAQEYSSMPAEVIELSQSDIASKNKFFVPYAIVPREISKIIVTHPQEMPLALFYLTSMISKDDKIKAMNYLLTACSQESNVVFQTYLNTPLPTHILGYRTIHQLRSASSKESMAVIDATTLLMTKEINVTPQSLSWVIGNDLRNEYDELIAAVTQAYTVLWKHNDLFAQFYAKSITHLVPSLPFPGTLGIAENGELVSMPA
jgi:hypothetical protein